MKYLKNASVCTLIMLGFIVITSFIFSSLYYFNIISSSISSFMDIIIPSISFLVSGIYMGKKVLSKGWLEGLKIGLILLFVFILISILLFNYTYDFKNLLYYIILLISSMLGGMIGINRKKN